jgi:hypothetical protein
MKATSSDPRSAYTGYLDVDSGAKHLFFYFFESRRDPDKGKRADFVLRSQFLTRCIVDDVMMWINGGATVSFLD